MSNMLDQVIIDAEALKEVAIKNAEAAIVEKYSNDIKKAVDQLLEQEQGPPPEDIAMMGGMAPPGTEEAPGGLDLGADVAKNLDPAYAEGVTTVNIPLHELVQEMKMGDLNPEEKQVRELVAEEVTGGEEVTAEGGEEVITIQESVLASILGEEFVSGDFKKNTGKPGPTPPKVGGGTPVGTVSKKTPALDVPLDTKAGGVTKAAPKAGAKFGGGTKLPPGKGTGGTITTKQNVAEDVENLEEQEDETPPRGEGPEDPFGAMEEQLQAYEHNYAKLYESHQDYEYNYAHLYQEAEQLHEQNEKFRGLLVKTQEKLNEVNVRNAQLHYTNRTLISDSLNERQKDKIVEAIQKSGTVEEAKTIFETLQSAVSGVRYNQTAPKSLNEAINKHSSAFLPRKREEKAHSDPSLVERMQTLAGIKRQTL